HSALRVEAVEPSPHPTGRGLPGFSLQLRGPAELNLGQGVYAITHPRHGCLQLFITPIRRPGLFEALQRDYRITLAGPTTLAALLNSLQMG
ncbi:DUF6916 family protein, partial [Vogesella mureinivorans]|uniref:DUF6916 family protein n=1 Tax=Vogesella mureinivorans TaxID=657276 RepID=UPI001981B47D